MTVTEADWTELRDDLDQRGFARIDHLLDAAVCRELARLYDERERFRSRVVMRRHGFGEGEYKYFAYPLPEPVQALRQTVYPELVPLADRWAERMGLAERFPPSHEEYLGRCRAAGQSRPTPLMLTYGPGDYNRLHQDLYGELHFPVQLVVMLSAPGDYDGGAFVLAETRPRMQTRAEAVSLGQGDALLFAVNRRPVPSARGFTRVTMRHGVSTVTRGRRTTLGVIFHDAA